MISSIVSFVFGPVHVKTILYLFILLFLPLFSKIWGCTCWAHVISAARQESRLGFYFILFLVGYPMYVFYESKIKGNNMGQGINSMSFLLKHFVFVGIEEMRIIPFYVLYIK